LSSVRDGSGMAAFELSTLIERLKMVDLASPKSHHGGTEKTKVLPRINADQESFNHKGHEGAQS
jgi:hypothetical protein